MSSTSVFADGPIDAQKLANPYSSKTTTARIAALFKNRPLNDHESGSGEESTPPPPPQPEPNPGPAQGPDPALKTLAESVSNTLIYSAIHLTNFHSNLSLFL